MIGAAEVNTSKEAKIKAAKILAEGLGQPEDWTMNAINNTRLATWGDNQAFFGLVQTNGVKGETIYTNMAENFAKVNAAPEKVPSWRSISDSSLIGNIELAGDMHKAEPSIKFEKATKQLEKAVAFSTKRITITFPSGSANLDENSKYIIQMKFGDIAKSFANSRIRVEGNTDSVGSEVVNKSLSYKRAKSVTDYLVKQYQFDSNRFIVVGNGAAKPVSENTTDEGRSKNRRTDFELLNE